MYPEEAGGSGLGLVDVTMLMEEMGRAVMPGCSPPPFCLAERRSWKPALERSATNGLPRIAT
jgi:hypothetical protein